LELVEIAKYVIDGILFQHKFGIIPYPEQQSNDTADNKNASADMEIYKTFHHSALMACGGGGGGGGGS